MSEFTRIKFVIALGFTLEPFLDCLLGLGQGFETILQHPEPLVGAVAG